jgi:predicted transcriptional regulator
VLTVVSSRQRCRPSHAGRRNARKRPRTGLYLPLTLSGWNVQRAGVSRNPTVGARLHPEIKEQLEEMAEERKTTMARLIEEWVKEKVEAESEKRSTDGESLPEGVYVPNSEKHDYAVKWFDERKGKTRRRYYKTRSGAIQGAKRLRG